MIKKYVSLHVEFHYSCRIYMKLEFSKQIFEKCSNMKFFIKIHSVENRVDPYGRADGRTDRRIDMTKLIVCLLDRASS